MTNVWNVRTCASGWRGIQTLNGHEGPIIADFKTSARSAEPLEITHEIQLSSYAFLFRHVGQRQEVGLEIRSLIKTKSPKIEFHAYPARARAHFRRLFIVFHEYVDALDRGRFNYRPGFGCGMCDYRERCRAWTGQQASSPLFSLAPPLRL